MVPLVAVWEPAVYPRAVLLRWLELRGDNPGPLYVQATRTGALREGLHRLSERAGRSLRRGLATAAAEKQHTLVSIIKQTRHKSADMALSYVADVEVWAGVSDGLFN